METWGRNVLGLLEVKEECQRGCCERSRKGTRAMRSEAGATGSQALEILSDFCSIMDSLCPLP